ncbi:MAG: AAA family ATPase [Rhodocyclaceae bacterium]
MYLDHFGLAEHPFRITPHTAYFFGGGQRGAVLQAILFAAEHDEGIVCVTGEVGVGKTMLCRMAIERLSASVKTIYFANPSLSPDALQQVIAHELGVASSDAAMRLRHIEDALIERYARHERVVLIVDEAHAMPAPSLEQLRLLSNLESDAHKLIQIVLFGQDELLDTLAARPLRSLRERITHRFTLAPLSRAEISDYLRWRLTAAGYKGPDLFTGASLRRLAKASAGLTRRINILADKALMAAFADNTRTITTTHVRRAIGDAAYPRTEPRWWRLAVATALAISIGWVAWRTLPQWGTPAPTAEVSQATLPAKAR